MNTRNVLFDTIRNPAGMARLVEGYSTIKRAREAKLTNEQIRQVFPDTKKFTSSELDGFMTVAGGLVKGDARFKRDVFD